MTQNELFDRFFSGDAALYFLVAKTTPHADIGSRDFARKKVEQGLSVLCWETETSADSYRDAHPLYSSSMRTIRLTFAEFNKLMDQNDPGRESFDGFILADTADLRYRQ